MTRHQPLAVAALLLCAACDTPPGTNPATMFCQVIGGLAWTQAGFTTQVTSPARCPFGIVSPGVNMSFSANVSVWRENVNASSPLEIRIYDAQRAQRAVIFGVWTPFGTEYRTQPAGNWSAGGAGFQGSKRDSARVFQVLSAQFNNNIAAASIPLPYFQTPLVTTEAFFGTLNPGQRDTIRAAANATYLPNPTYVWYRDGSKLTTTSSHVTDRYTSPQSHWYKVVVTSGAPNPGQQASDSVKVIWSNLD